MFDKDQKPKLHEILKSKFLGLSLKRDDNFVRNIILSFAVIFVRAGVWRLADKYIIRDSDIGSIFCITIGIILLFIIDGDISQLGRGQGNDKNK